MRKEILMDTKNPTYDEVMSQKPVFISECDGYLYVLLPAREYYDNTIWKVDKKTHEVSYMMFTDYIINVSAHAAYVVKPDYET